MDGSVAAVTQSRPPAMSTRVEQHGHVPRGPAVVACGLHAGCYKVLVDATWIFADEDSAGLNAVDLSGKPALGCMRACVHAHARTSYAYVDRYNGTQTRHILNIQH